MYYTFINKPKFFLLLINLKTNIISPSFVTNFYIQVQKEEKKKFINLFNGKKKLYSYVGSLKSFQPNLEINIFFGQM